MINSGAGEEDNAPRDLPRSRSKLTQEQYQSLLALLQPVTSSGPMDSPKPSQPSVSQVGPSTLSSSGPNLGNSFALCFFHHFSCTTQSFTPTTSTYSGSWIIDSGATDHITASLQWFQVY